ncbi:acetyltransferase [Devosia pacifica]|uniref:Acetyltransferase n=1 Tax=Devosia pacifica TaxID=1335967 RepID=A0A918S9C3_9HYPH|nr:GNAT family N-acetyltransferase [Devosia pacifica]GHA28151.1 acetyltransferase [Devosia pacifica]
MTELHYLRVPAFSTLSQAAFRLRREVFVAEQGVPEEIELDADDLVAQHHVAIAEGEVVATLRVVFKPEHAKIGRVAVSKAWRRRGIARALLMAAMQECRRNGHDRFYLAAQIDKLGLYEGLGFQAFGGEFMDGGMPHRAMRTYDLDEQ